MSQNTDNLLLSVINSKDAIKAALESKGVDMTDVKFSEYAFKIMLIDNKPTSNEALYIDTGISATIFTIPE